MKVYTIHGWSFDGNVWRGTPYREAIHLGLPGHPGSSFSSADLEKLAEEVGSRIERGVLVGWSLGASVAVIAASEFKSKVKRLVLYAPTLKFSGISQEKVIVKRFLKNLKRDFRGTVLKFRSLCSERVYPVPDLDEGTVIPLLESFCGLDLSPWAERVSSETFILVGEEDRVTCLSGAFSLYRRIPSSVLSVIPGADHVSILNFRP